MSLNRADVLALLEERPYPTTELAGVLGVDERTLRLELLRMGRASLVKRVGMAQHWALPAFVAKPGRRTTPAADLTRARLLELIAAGPQAVSALTQALGLSKTALR